MDRRLLENWFNMRYSLFILLALISFSSIVSAEDSPNSPFVVVELFSSEGCSDCPAADLLVSKLTAWARENKEPIYPLIFHVDYWNNQGWRDVYSSHEFTQRQGEYARIFKDQGMYTPQMIVNGSDVFVGSNQAQLQKDMNRELTIPAPVALRINLTKQGGQVLVNYQVQGFNRGDIINFALVERGLSTEVTAGENAGRTLHHDNVVREFQSMRLKQAISQVTMPLNKISDTAQASVIVYVQNPQTLLIEGAQQVDLENG
jgi:hypothetical protein